LSSATEAVARETKPFTSLNYRNFYKPLIRKYEGDFLLVGFFDSLLGVLFNHFK
jgi:hypothetical protein